MRRSARRWAWIGGGRHRTSTTHVDNVVEGLARERGAPGGVYFVTDGEPVVFRDFMERLLATRTSPCRRTCRPGGATVAAVGETAWRVRLPGQPPAATCVLAGLAGVHHRHHAGADQLGYAPVRTMDDGMEDLARAHRNGV